MGATKFLLKFIINLNLTAHQLMGVTEEAQIVAAV